MADGPPGEDRRSFLGEVAGAMAAIGAALAAWPLAASLAPPTAGPDRSTLPVDLDGLAPGAQRVVAWRGMPILLVRRTPAEIAALGDPARDAELLDPGSREPQQPDYARGPTRSADPSLGVLVGICTHLGCLPGFEAARGWLCPCHGSRYDLAGRVLRGSPARYNLPVPPYRQEGDRITLGDRSADPGWSLSKVRRL